MKNSILIVISVFLLLGCSTLKEDWERTRSSDTDDAYETFLKAYPDSEFSSTAMSILKEREIERKKERQAWNQATKDNTYLAYRDYIKRFPQGEHSDTAKSKLRSIISFFRLEPEPYYGTGTKKRYIQKSFVMNYHIGDNRVDIERRLGKADAEEPLPSALKRCCYRARSFLTSIELTTRKRPFISLRTLILLFDTNDVLVQIDVE